MRLRGLERKHEQDPLQLIRDTRTLTQRMQDFFQEPRNGGLVILSFAMASFLFYSLSDIIFIVGILTFIYAYTRKYTLPFRMPMRSKMMDYNDPKPGSINEPRMARGICYYGNEKETFNELWFNNEDMRTHTLIFGSTGSGKTETLISLAYNALVFGSGFIYVDGKGDNALFAKIFSMCRALGREDDLLLINFMTGARDIVGPQEKRISNTMNPFAIGSSSMLSQLVVSLMASSSKTPDGDMWKGRAISFVEALMKPLVFMRDEGKILLDANSVRNYFTLEKLESIAIDKIFPRDNDEPVSLADVPDVIIEPIYNYMINLPGYQKSKKGKQVSQVYEQHGYITMQLTRVFTSLADTYGHILRTNLAEVDLKDVVLNRRILVVLLPALEKAPEELANLGKVIIASLKSMMAAGLGEEVEGTYKDVILRKPYNAPTPFVCILDEYGYYAVEGFSVVPAQARSLGFSVIFAGQDLPAFQKASKEEAASIGANTNIKIAMKLEDPMETWEFFSKTAGESYVTKVDSFQTDSQSVLNHYLDAKSASAEKRARVDLLDLKEQREGEAHIFFKSQIIRAKMPFMNPPPVPRMRLNHFLKIEAPTTRALIAMKQSKQQFEAVFKSGDFEFPPMESNPDIDLLADKMKNDAAPTLIERGVSALLAYADTKTQAIKEKAPELLEERTDKLDLFTKVKLPEICREFVSMEDWDAFAAPFLLKHELRDRIEQIEQLLGQPQTKAIQIARELVRDMRSGSIYPPEIQQKATSGEMVSWIQEFLQSLGAEAP